MLSRPLIARSKRATLQALTLGWLLSFVAFIANAEEFVEGKDYRVVETEVEEELADADAESDDTIRVVEFFNYGCPHCYKLEPIIKDWLEEKGDDVEFIREAVPLRTAWVPLARAYYVAEEFDVTSKVHPILFKAIFEHDLQMQRVDLLEKLFENYGVEAEDFHEVYASDEVLDAMRETQTQMRLFGLKGTPAVVIANKYVINTELADGHERMFEIVEFLVEKIRTENKKSS